MRLSSEIHRDPELGCREMHTVTRLAGELEEEGFDVETGTAGLATAFRAEYSAGGAGPTIAFLCEYDALPGLGHGGGHNLIALATHGAALGLSAVLGQIGGRVVVIGAPAEETIGGKVVLAVRGAFDDLDVALLSHPAGESRAIVHSLASWSVEVSFEGRAAHAVTDEGLGINALEALIALFNRRGELLAELGDTFYLPGVILDGGLRPNLVPDHARARFSLRAPNTPDLIEKLLPRFKELVATIANATGASASVRTIDNLYDEFLANPVLAQTWTRHAREAGLDPVAGEGAPMGSLDMGTLSFRIPALHPTFRIADEALATHTEAFAAAAISPRAQREALHAAQAMALTGLELLTTPELLSRVREAHELRIVGRKPRIDAPLIDRPPGA